MKNRPRIEFSRLKKRFLAPLYFDARKRGPKTWAKIIYDCMVATLKKIVFFALFFPDFATFRKFGKEEAEYKQFDNQSIDTLHICSHSSNDSGRESSAQRETY